MRLPPYMALLPLMLWWYEPLTAQHKPGSDLDLADSLHRAVTISTREGDIATAIDELKLLQQHYRSSPECLPLATRHLHDIEPHTRQDSQLLRKGYGVAGYNIKKYLGDIHRSNTYYLRAHELRDTSDWSDRRYWYIEKIIADNYARLNQHDHAAAYYLMVTTHLQKVGHGVNLSRTYADLCKSYGWQGQDSLALVYGHRAYALAREIGADQGIIAASMSLSAHHLDRGQLEPYEQYSSIALEHIHELAAEDQLDRMVDWLDQQARYLQAMGHLEQAVDTLRRVIDIRRGHGAKIHDRELAKNYARCAAILLDLERYKAAQSAIQDGRLALSHSPESSAALLDNTHVELELTQSELYRRYYLQSADHSYADSCLTSLTRAEMHLDNLIDGMYLDRDRVLIYGYRRSIIDMAVSVLYEMQQDVHPSFDYSLVQYYMERSKAGLRYRLDRSSPATYADSTQAKIYSLEGELRAIAQRRSTSNARSVGDEIRYTTLRKQLDGLLYRNKEEQEIHPITEYYIDYLTTDAGIYVHCHIDEPTLHYVPWSTLPRRTITTLATALRERQPVDSLVGVVAGHLLPVDVCEITRLSIIPDGVVHLFPVELLVAHQCSRASAPIITYRSTSRAKTVPATLSPEDLKIYIACPDYSSIAATSTAPDTRSSLAHLPFAQMESASISDRFPSAMVDPQPALGNMITGSQTYDILHYAGHAQASNDEAYLLLMAGTEVQRISTAELDHWSNDFALVVLSACETGIGSLLRGEGIKSLASTFTNNGADAVLYSLWKVNDQSTSMIIEDFYRLLQTGKARSEALHLAKQHYLDGVPAARQHPYFWSGLVLLESTQSISSHKQTNQLWLLITLLLAGSIAIWRYYRS